MPFYLRHYRWLIIGLLFFTAVVNNLDRQTLSVLAPTLRTDLGISPERYSYIVSAFLAAYTLGYAFSGPLVDRVGVKLALGTALACWSVISGLHAFATGWLSLAVLRFLLGLAESFNTPAAIKAITDWVPSRERALCVAIYNNGFVAGSILAPPLVAVLTLNLGWHWSFLVSAAFGLILLALWQRFYDSPEQSPRVTAAERDYILKGRAVASARPSLSLLALAQHPVAIGFFVSRFLTDPFSYFFNFWLPDYFQRERGFSLALLGLIGWLPYLAGDIGGPGGGAFSDWLVRRGWSPTRARLRLMLGAACVMPVANLAVRTTETWLAMALISVMFAAQTCWMANQLSLLSEKFSRENVATVIAFSAIGGGCGGMVATLLTGRAVATYGYLPVFTGMSLLHLTAIVVVVVALRRADSSRVAA